MKHTQGEWYVKEGQIYPLETGKTLALIPYYNGTEEQEANAKLMAAAPELLEELIKAKEVIGMLAEHLNYTSARWRSEHVRPIEDLIYKLS